MRELDHPPHAPALTESMRAVGYSLESAIADLIDNSISADARSIRILFSPYGEPYIAIIDDGLGMNPEELTHAMRHGAQSPTDVRTTNDLGRFGLGMKTASLSQCRELTVVSMKSGQLSAAQWDLDVIAATEKWTLLLLDPIEIEKLPVVKVLLSQDKGTMVLWRRLDRLSAGEGSVELALGDGMVRVREHLALVFHRFLSQEGSSGKMDILINENPVSPLDPFLTWHRATQQLPEESIRVGGALVLVQPFILPHYSKLDPRELELAGGEEGLRRQQGFYVYRNRRLIIWGTWFRLARQEELSKLARVRVDMPNTLDHLWTLDIKKSVAHPPLEVRQNLKRIVERIAESSRRVYTYRARRANDDTFVHIWDRTDGRDGISYRINREHPIIKSVEGRLDDTDVGMFHSALKALEEMFPTESLYGDMASDKRHVQQRPPTSSQEELADLAGQLLDACGTNRAARCNLLSSLHLLEPFSYYPDLTRAIVARMHDER
jgi:hypothetical protein